MTEFIAIVEVWEDGKIQYTFLEMLGHKLPDQENMDEREAITDILKESTELDILDMIGLIYEGDLIWTDIPSYTL